MIASTPTVSELDAVRRAWPLVTVGMTVGEFLSSYPDRRAVLVADGDGNSLVALVSNHFDVDLVYLAAADHRHDRTVCMAQAVMPLLVRALQIGEAHRAAPAVPRQDRLW